MVPEALTALEEEPAVEKTTRSKDKALAAELALPLIPDFFFMTAAEFAAVAQTAIICTMAFKFANEDEELLAFPESLTSAFKLAEALDAVFACAFRRGAASREPAAEEAAREIAEIFEDAANEADAFAAEPLEERKPRVLLAAHKALLADGAIAESATAALREPVAEDAELTETNNLQIAEREAIAEAEVIEEEARGVWVESAAEAAEWLLEAL